MGDSNNDDDDGATEDVKDEELELKEVTDRVGREEEVEEEEEEGNNDE